MANFQQANFKQSPGKQTSNYSGTTLSSWSRQQKIAMIAGFVILGLLIGISACSKQTSKTALVGISSPASSTARASIPLPTPVPATTPAPTVAKKKVKKHPAAIVTYQDANSGVSFRYPRKYELATGEDEQMGTNSAGQATMNFTQPGGTAVASVSLPEDSYPGTDFTKAYFTVNVNRNVSEPQCSEFAFVDARNPDGEPVDAEKIRQGSVYMEKTSDFAADAMKQSESQYYHRYENGACYEFVLGLNTEGFGTKDSIQAVDRDEVFAKLEKILATVKVNPIETEKTQVAVKQSEAASEQAEQAAK
jgi:hypothetical protein